METAQHWDTLFGLAKPNPSGWLAAGSVAPAQCQCFENCCLEDAEVCVFSPLTISTEKALTLVHQTEKPVEAEARDMLDSFNECAELHCSSEFFEVDFSDLKVLNSIGSGGSAAYVYKALWNDLIVAFKCFKTETQVGEQNFEQFQRECDVFARLRHPSILQFYGVTLRPPRVGIVMEYCPYGDLDDFLQKHPDFPIRDRVRMLSEIAGAVKYLHATSIIHRDLKTQNILVDVNLRAKLMDFGLSRLVERMSVSKTKFVGTAIYMAPEVATNMLRYDHRCDVYSFGIMLWIVLTGNDKPYGPRPHNIQYKVAKNPELRPDHTQIPQTDLPRLGRRSLVLLMTKCWAHNPDERPNFDEIVVCLKGVKDDLPDTGYEFVPPEPESEDDTAAISSQVSMMGTASAAAAEAAAEGGTTTTTRTAAAARTSPPPSIPLPVAPVPDPVTVPESSSPRGRSRSRSRSLKRRGSGRASSPSASASASAVSPFARKIHLKLPNQADSSEVDLGESTLEGLKRVAARWAKCRPENILRLMKTTARGKRKVSRDETVEKLSTGSLIIVYLRQ